MGVNMKTSEILNATADYLKEFGVATNWFPSWGQPACLEGAGKLVCQTNLGREWRGRWYHEVKPALTTYLTETRPEHALDGAVLPWVWFDMTEGREAIEVLRTMAVIEEAKENAEVLEPVA